MTTERNNDPVPLTIDEFYAIEAHLTACIAGHGKTIAMYRASNVADGGDWVKKQIAYNRNAISALKHCLATAKQRARIKPHVTRSSVQ